MEKRKNKYFYCYSNNLKNRLLEEGERFICVGINERSNKRFWLFEQSEKLSEVLTDWKERKTASTPSK